MRGAGLSLDATGFGSSGMIVMTHAAGLVLLSTIERTRPVIVAPPERTVVVLPLN
ncbi:hypothetical protein JQ553_20180 [Bradyrhizobium lablabi]|nr:hypothetical protein [Bradyrhizobium lablabi]